MGSSSLRMQRGFTDDNCEERIWYGEKQRNRVFGWRENLMSGG